MSEAISRGRKVNNDVRHGGGGIRPDLRELRQKEAKERLEAWQALTSEQKLAALDARRKAGLGDSVRQRARIARTAGVKPAPKADAVKAETPKTKAKDRKAAEQVERPSR